MTSTTTTTKSSNGQQQQIKTPLKKEELEQIAKQLKKKLSKAGLTAKQSLSPTNLKSNNNNNNNGINSNNTTPISLPKSSPLKSYIVNKNRNSSHSNLNNFSPISSSPLYSPNNKSPTHMKTPAAAMYLSSSPLKNQTISEESQESSPTKKRKTSPSKMILEELSPNSKKESSISSLKPSIDLKSSPIERKQQENQQQHPQTTPKMANKEICSTPKARTRNDSEGADLLLYLATSPSPAKQSYYSNTPKQQHKSPPPSQPTQTANTSNVPQFVVPPPPVTPKRVGSSSISNNLSKTPQRLTPFMSIANNNGLPSSGLTLTPTGFNMSDYVNIFTPSPGSLLNKNLLKTPDFNNLLNGNQTPRGSSKVDGKLLNFNKMLFSNHSDSKE
ncbi:unnamed protein product [Candida verbasci]|uniref:Uncharacterized protein n=1 Tax=Candida verbasci TaxID=1227364 RepID=A0A9W4XNI7_9ASCO|nr:unnamed protein product [Candida verbasci]